jgi:hypothetical protein
MTTPPEHWRPSLPATDAHECIPTAVNRIPTVNNRDAELKAWMELNVEGSKQILVLKARNAELEGQCWEYVKRIDDLKALLDRATDALETIASEHKPRHETEEYWTKIDHSQCAVVLATDTKIARKALTEIRQARSAEGEG